MGMYGQKFGKYGMSRGLPIPKDKPTLAEFLRDNGYVTGQVGKWDIGYKEGPSSRGFMEVAEIPPRVDENQPRYLAKDKEGKPVGINTHIGRRPIAAFGNSDGDLQMLQWTMAGEVCCNYGNGEPAGAESAGGAAVAGEAGAGGTAV